jgi:hypothetical protein
VSYQPRPLFINSISYIFRCYDITQLSHRSLVNCISDERKAKFTNPKILNVHGIVKSTERHTTDTQITDSTDFIKSRLSPRLYNIQPRLLFASYRPYDVNNYYIDKGPYSPTSVKVNCRLKCFVTLVTYCYNNVFVYFNLQLTLTGVGEYGP